MSCQSTPVSEQSLLLPCWHVVKIQVTLSWFGGPMRCPWYLFIGFFGCGLRVGEDTGAP
ncbi:unnamed protein product [Staurois parvus]|uniref:Uncharacterized protein n=1 Tax=Staurois parvus TaxID=386267 RepID=A0ABN9BCH0_9NEOB|nr:unnamed protein product [Staurois parvus]